MKKSTVIFSAVVMATVAVAAVLSIWYVLPWRQAARLRDELLSEGVRVVAGLPDSPPPSLALFEGVPWYHLGVCMFVEGHFSAALSPLLDGRVAVEDVPPDAVAWNAMSASDLVPGEYLVSWNTESQSMVVERAGAHPLSEHTAGGPP